MLLEMADIWEELSNSASKTRPHTVRLQPYQK